MKAKQDSPPVVLVDDEPQILKSFSIMLNSMGYRNVVTLDDSRKVLPLLSERDVAVLVLDLSMPHVSGIDLLGQVSLNFPQLPVIIVTARNELETAVECMRSGAFDYLVKPVDKSRLEASITRAFEVCMLRNEISSLKKHLLMGDLENEEAFDSIITINKKMRGIFQYVEVLSSSNQPVLITGETGVGKELIARAVHDISGRPGQFVAVNVAGLDDTMFSDTLFGHKKGAYTGAGDTREGLISQAAGGTLFLDEIGDTSESSQVKLLRLLQEHKYYPLGSDVPKSSDVRVAVATNRDLQKEISEDNFRQDLYYRLCAHHIHVPPLRERTEDIPVLLNHFLEKGARQMKKTKPTPPPELVTLLKTYAFPGNVRELESMAYDAVARHKSGMLSMESFKTVIKSRAGKAQVAETPVVAEDIGLKCTPENFPTLKKAEEFLVDRALDISGGNQGIAANLLGISRQALNKRINRKKSD